MSDSKQEADAIEKLVRRALAGVSKFAADGIERSVSPESVMLLTQFARAESAAIYARVYGAGGSEPDSLIRGATLEELQRFYPAPSDDQDKPPNLW